MEANTHRALSRALCGTPRALQLGSAVVTLDTTTEMCADEHGLVHGGFIFGLADHAAMLAINQPTVVLASADVRFLAPVVVGDQLQAEARVAGTEGKRQRVDVSVKRGAQKVFEGSFVCVVPARHVLDGVRGDPT